MYAEIADTNRLSSCSRRRRLITGINPKGCWDWWGYTGLDYLGKEAPQIKAILDHGRAACRPAMNTPEMEDDLSVVEAPFGSELYRQALALREAILREPLGLTLTAEEQADDRSASISARRPTARWWVGLAQAARRARPSNSGRWRWRRSGGGRASGRGCSASPKTGRAAKATGSMVLNARLGAEGFYARYRLPGRRRALRREHHAAYQDDQAVSLEEETHELEVGDKAPDFTLPADGGGTVSLKALKGKTSCSISIRRTTPRAARRRHAPSATRCPTSPR